MRKQIAPLCISSSTRFLAALLATVAFSLLGLGSTMATAAEEDSDKDYRAAVKAFLELANTPAMGEQIAYMMAEQTLAGIAATGAPITDPMREIVLEEAMTTFEPTFGDIEYLTDLNTPLYKEHFTAQEIRDLIAFYETPLGHKVTEALPQISQAAGMALQQASFEKVPAFQSSVDARLKAAGIEIQP